MSSHDGESARQSFERLVADSRGRWVRSAQHLLQNEADAEDVVQETLAALWRRWERSRPHRPEAYAARAVRLNALKRRARRRNAATLPDQDLVALPSNPEQEETLDAGMLERALAGLPATQQAVLRARFYMGLTFAQIGRRLSISSNTVASRCRYALAALRRRFRK